MTTFMKYIAVVLLLATFFGCGRGQGGDSNPAKKKSAGSSITGPSARAFDTPSCPSSLASSSGSADAPVADIRGLSIGHSADDSINYIECLDPKAKFARDERDHTTAVPNFGRAGRTLIALDTGTPLLESEIAALPPTATDVIFHRFNPVTEKYELLALGEPNQEIVYGIWREQDFQSGSYPAVETLVTQLKAKYGEPQAVETGNTGGPRLIWKFDPEERPMTKANPNFRNCSIRTDIGLNTQWTDVCGLTIGAEIWKNSGNSLLATKLTVGVLEQARLMKVTKELGAKWKAADEAQKQSEAAAAAKGTAPKL